MKRKNKNDNIYEVTIELDIQDSKLSRSFYNYDVAKTYYEDFKHLSHSIRGQFYNKKTNTIINSFSKGDSYESR